MNRLNITTTTLGTIIGNELSENVGTERPISIWTKYHKPRHLRSFSWLKKSRVLEGKKGIGLRISIRILNFFWDFSRVIWCLWVFFLFRFGARREKTWKWESVVVVVLGDKSEIGLGSLFWIAGVWSSDGFWVFNLKG